MMVSFLLLNIAIKNMANLACEILDVQGKKIQKIKILMSNTQTKRLNDKHPPIKNRPIYTLISPPPTIEASEF